MLVFVTAVLISIRLILGEMPALITGAPGCQALGVPADSRRARILCAWAAAQYCARQKMWSGLWRGYAAFNDM